MPETILCLLLPLISMQHPPARPVHELDAELVHLGGYIVHDPREVIEEEQLCERSAHLGEVFLKRMNKMKEEHPIVGDARGKGCLLAIELVKDKDTKEPFEEAGKLVYQRAFSKGLAWVPAGHILRLSPPLIMDDDLALKGLDIIDEAIGEVEKELGY